MTTLRTFPSESVSSEALPALPKQEEGDSSQNLKIFAPTMQVNLSHRGRSWGQGVLCGPVRWTPACLEGNR